ncbi:MAG: hypothetical protein IJO09_01210 [Oscillospiraceae bacterium]|nr:hypothetical protein [Oscillospiraceae bacterium]
MNYILLAATILGVTAQGIVSKQYSLKAECQNSMMFSAVSAFFAMIFFVICGVGSFNLNPDVVPYSIAFGVFYCMALFGGLNAIRTGPLSISVLVNQFGLIIPTLYGIIWLGDDIGACGYIGIVLLFTALVFVNLKNEKLQFSRSWFIWLAVEFVGNGMCSTVQKMQQLKFGGAYKNEYMIIALLFVTLASLVSGLYKNKNIGKSITTALRYAPIQGVANGAVNLFVMLLTGLLPTAILFPSISAGGMAITFAIAILFYKEKLSKVQILGYMFGIISVVLLNI